MLLCRAVCGYDEHQNTIASRFATLSILLCFASRERRRCCQRFRDAMRDVITYARCAVALHY